MDWARVYVFSPPVSDSPGSLAVTQKPLSLI